jgi:hypothetical protein
VSADHLPARSSWDCVACGAPWPCDAARRDMSARMNPERLAVVMFDYYAEAAGELIRTPLCELYERFVAWTPSRRQVA